MRLVDGEGKPQRLKRTAGWRSSRAAAFFVRFNAAHGEGGALPDETWAAPRRSFIAALVGVTLLAALTRLPFAGTAYQASDTTHYLEVAHSIFHGGFLDNLRPPGYELVLALVELAGVDPVNGVIAFQNLVGMVLPAVAVVVGWRFFNPVGAVLAGVLTAASPLMAITEQFALADYLFGVILFCATGVLAEAVIRIRERGQATRLLALAGALFGLAALFRANGLLGLVAIPMAALLATRSWRLTLRASAVAILAMLAVLAPWMIHNLVRFGNASIATEGGISLYARAVSYDQVAPSPDTADGRIALSVYQTADPTVAHGRLDTTVGVYNALIASGKGPSEASSAMGAVARDAILRHPGVFLENTLTVLGLDRNLYDPHTVTANRYLDQIITTRNYFRSVDPKVKNVPGNSSLTRIPWQIAQSLTKVLYLLSLGGIVILLLPFLGGDRSRLAGMVFLLVGSLGLVGGSLTAIYSPRYDVMFAPFVWILASAAVVLLVQLLAAAGRECNSWRMRRAQVTRRS